MTSGATNILSTYLDATASDKSAGLSWYSDASIASYKIHPMGPAIVAAVSPGLRWERNIECADRIVRDAELSGLGVRWYDGVRKARRILTGETPDTVLKGNKVRNFAKCLADPSDNVAVCVDGHAYSIWDGRRIMLDKIPTMSNKLYAQIADDYRIAASVANILPMQMQAITWVVWRRVHGVVKTAA